MLSLAEVDGDELKVDLLLKQSQCSILGCRRESIAVELDNHAELKKLQENLESCKWESKSG